MCQKTLSLTLIEKPYNEPAFDGKISVSENSYFGSVENIQYKEIT